MRATLLLICICTTSVIFAQRDCASASYLESEKIANPSLSRKIADLESYVSKQFSLASGQNLKTVNSVIRIPVVVHVLYSNDNQNISEQQIQSQLDVLNKDFRRKNADTANTPDRFKSVAGDAGIEFFLATSDPSGRPTNGIVRKKTNILNFTTDDKIKFSSKGGDDAWDSKSYLNIWVGNLKGALGYATAPGTDAAKDGLVIAFSAFGTINASAPYNLGRTAVHEIGHWLGLKHIWGDNYCGDDFVGDTPPQGSFTSGCPSTFRSTCSNGSLGDMYMNFMDFTNDACLNLFTKGQTERMRSMFNTGGPRVSLLTSKGLNAPWVFEAALPEAVINRSTSVYPNPASDVITVNFNGDESWIGKKVQIVSTTGVVLQEVKLSSTIQKISLTPLQSGIYFVKADNGSSKLIQKLVKL